ncbi:MAG: hypothetical protein H6Q82_2946 [Deltaproteobacteria bacterium]|nr:hypothetical protein [Deltaproteobacteria bacterium]
MERLITMADAPGGRRESPSRITAWNGEPSGTWWKLSKTRTAFGGSRVKSSSKYRREKEGTSLRYSGERGGIGLRIRGAAFRRAAPR